MAKLITARDWTEATAELVAFIGPCDYTLGAGYDYPSPFAVFTKDAWSGAGRGYEVYSTKNGRCDRLVASITIT